MNFTQEVPFPMLVSSQAWTDKLMSFAMLIKAEKKINFYQYSKLLF